MSTRSATRLAWALWAVGVAGCAVFVVLETTRHSSDLGGSWFNAQEALGALVFPTVGAIVASRRKENPLGWLFLAIGVSFGISAVGGAITDVFAFRSATWQWGTWLQTWSWAPGWVFMITYLLLLFPDGRLPSRRWAWVAWVTGTAVVLMVLAGVFDRTAGGTAGYQSPLPTWPDSVVGFFQLSSSFSALVASVASVVALVRRFRRSTGAERQQMKWFAYAGVATVVLIPGRVIVFAHVPAMVALGLLSIPILPVAAGLAILRYRLYDIDRVVNRTLVYGALTAVLVGVYVALAVGLGSVAGRDNSLVIAGSTLVVAALFRPARRRLQGLVDRRFYRRKYDAARTLEAFTARLREEVDLEELREHLLDVVGETMQPAQATLWLRTAEGIR
ncbi:MAG: hypothetical protein M3Q23_13470 [Actinomycetota bacterium]|nr:hypothetical protein [Actinomycetota bacterium]